MQVRVFESVDMASGLKMIRQELGPDALILSTRTVRNGKLGLLGKPMLEITAAVDVDMPRTLNTPPDSPRQPDRMVPPPPRDSYQKTGFRHIVDDPIDDYLPGQSGSDRRNYHRAGSEPPMQQSDYSLSRQADQQGLQGEVDELKELVRNLAGQITKLSTREREVQSFAPEEPQAKDVTSFARRQHQPIVDDHLLTMLIDRGINDETSQSIAGYLQQSLTEEELSDPAYAMETIISTIQNLVKVAPPVFAAGQKQQRIALVGPTGVGKTTTLAKIAANYLSKHSHSVALITIDTYRIAAVEQLKVYGEIMRLPVDVVITPAQLQKALHRHHDKELILIDTAGRSPRDSYCIDELATFLPKRLDIAKHLVLSAGGRENELLSTIDRFDTLGINNTIFTKIDECATLGILLNVQLQNSSPVSYVTNGQRVPEDLLEITPKIIAQLIMSQYQGSLHD